MGTGGGGAEAEIVRRWSAQREAENRWGGSKGGKIER